MSLCLWFRLYPRLNPLYPSFCQSKNSGAWKLRCPFTRFSFSDQWIVSGVNEQSNRTGRCCQVNSQRNWSVCRTPNHTEQYTRRCHLGNIIYLLSAEISHIQWSMEMALSLIILASARKGNALLACGNVGQRALPNWVDGSKSVSTD